VTEFVRFREESVLGRRHGKFVVEEEYKNSAREDLTCDLKTLYVYVLQHSDIGSV
jgi:hypothetical protein